MVFHLFESNFDLLLYRCDRCHVCSVFSLHASVCCLLILEGDVSSLDTVDHLLDLEFEETFQVADVSETLVEGLVHPLECMDHSAVLVAVSCK